MVAYALIVARVMKLEMTYTGRGMKTKRIQSAQDATATKTAQREGRLHVPTAEGPLKSLTYPENRV